MPASPNYTLIRLMRGNIETSEAWVPDIGEPLLDMESGTLRYGDNKTLGGIPINTVTSVDLDCPRDLDTCKTWGRYFLNGEVTSLPTGVESPGKFFLTVMAQDLGSAEIWQTLQVLEGVLAGKTFNRHTLNSGITWTSWRDTSGTPSWNASGSGTDDGDSNLNNYTQNSEVYVENLVNGPEGTEGCDGFLFTYRKNPLSPYVFQKLILVKCPEYNGRIFYRYSATGGEDWEEPGFNWQELSDNVHKDLLNATGILPAKNGGTQRNDGTTWQSDQARITDYTLNENKWQENPYIQTQP